MTQPNKTETKPSAAADTKAESAGKKDTTQDATQDTTKDAVLDHGHYARLNTAPETSEFVRNVGYQEDENYVPDPFFQYGTVDTSDTSGGAQSRIQEVSPVFDVARARNLAVAEKALDPNDPTPAELVVLPGEVNTADTAKERLSAAVQEIRDNPIEVGGPSVEQRLAAEGEGPEKTEEKPATETKAPTK